MTISLERLPDPLTEAVLGVAEAAANAGLADRLERLGYTETEVAIASTANYPVDAKILGGELSLPLLSCYVVSQQSRRTTFYHLDEDVTLRLHYVCSATGEDRLDERWPVLGVVWRDVFAALYAGGHEDYLDDACALEDAGVVWISSAPTVRYGYLPDGAYAYPQFVADVRLTWRPQDGAETVLYPMLGADLVIQQAGEVLGSGFDVYATANTPEGAAAVDAEPYEEEAVLP